MFRIATWSMDDENAPHNVYQLFKKYKEFVEFIKVNNFTVYPFIYLLFCELMVRVFCLANQSSK